MGAGVRRGVATGPVRLPGSSAAEEEAILAAVRLTPDRIEEERPRWRGFIAETTEIPPAVPDPGDRPIVVGIDLDVLREGEAVTLDGERGTVELPGAEAVAVVTSFLERADGRILLLRRSERVGSFRGHWAGVSGFLEDATAEEQALREIREETGVEAKHLTLAARGRLVYARDGARVYVVHPFRFRSDAPEIRLDWEHTEHAWVDPAEIGRRPTVPKLDRVWAAVAPRGPGEGPGAPKKP